MPYTGTEINDLDVTLPDGAVEPVKNLDDAIREVKNILKTVWLVGHESTGPHKPNSITTTNIVDLAIITQKIADLAVTTAKLADASVTAVKLAPNAAVSNLTIDSILNSHLAANSVTGNKILNNTITPDKLSAGTAGQILISDGGAMAFKNVSGDVVIDSNGIATVLKAVKLNAILLREVVSGTLTSSSWADRLFIESLDEGNLCSVVGPNINLEVGKYLVIGNTTAFNVGAFQSRVFNSTTSAVVFVGQSSIATLDTQGGSLLFGLVNVTDAAHNYRIQTFVETSRSAFDKGHPASTSAGEIYSQVLIIPV